MGLPWPPIEADYPDSQYICFQNNTLQSRGSYRKLIFIIVFFFKLWFVYYFYLSYIDKMACTQLLSIPYARGY